MHWKIQTKALARSRRLCDSLWHPSYPNPGAQEADIFKCNPSIEGCFWGAFLWFVGFVLLFWLCVCVCVKETHCQDGRLLEHWMGWGRGWEIHCYDPCFIFSLSPLISSLFKIFSLFFLLKSWILCVICWFADRVRNVPFLPAHHTSPDSKS